MLNDIKFTLTVEYSGDIKPEALFDSKAILEGISTKLSDGQVAIEVKAYEEGLGFAEGTIIEFLVTFGANVAAGLVATALYNAFAKGVRHFLINGRRVRATKKDLESAILTQCALENPKITNSSDLS